MLESWPVVHLLLMQNADGQRPWWVTSVVLTLAGTTLTSSGLMIQKYSHDNEDDEEETVHLTGHAGRKAQRWCGLRPFSARWLLGFFVFVSGHLLCWFGLALGTKVVLTCLNVWSMIVTFVVAPMLLNETVSVYKMGCVLFIIVGVVIVIIFGPRIYRPYTTSLFLSSLDNVVFLGASICVACCLLLLAAKALILRRQPRLSAVEFTLTAALIGCYSALSAKCAAGLIFTSVHHQDSQLGTWTTWAVILALAILATLNINFMNLALKHGEAVFVLPIYESCSILGQILLGGVFFREFDSLSINGHMRFWSGVCFVLVGIICITGRPPPYELLNRPVLSPSYAKAPWPSKASRPEA